MGYRKERRQEKRDGQKTENCRLDFFLPHFSFPLAGMYISCDGSLVLGQSMPCVSRASFSTASFAGLRPTPWISR